MSDVLQPKSVPSWATSATKTADSVSNMNTEFIWPAALVIFGVASHFCMASVSRVAVAFGLLTAGDAAEIDHLGRLRSSIGSAMASFSARQLIISADTERREKRSGEQNCWNLGHASDRPSTKPDWPHSL